MALYSGLDVIMTAPGEHESMLCPICNKKMKVKRNVNGPTSWAASIMKKDRLHDVFTCKHAEKDWHKQVRQLKQEISSTPSAKLAKMFQEEIDEILQTKHQTKVTDAI